MKGRCHALGLFVWRAICGDEMDLIGLKCLGDRLSSSEVAVMDGIEGSA